MVEYDRPLNLVFHALSDPTRRAMLAQLRTAPLTVSDLASPHDMSLAGASKHIGVLERARLVRRERQGRQHICHLEAGALAEAYHWLDDYAAFWNACLDTLETLLQQEMDPSDD